MTAEFPDVDLAAEVMLLLEQIPRGQVTTYGDLARALGDDKTRSARWIGEFLVNHQHHSGCPCHRVVRLTGEVGLHYSGDANLKASLLKREGVSVSSTGHVDLTDRFTAFHSTRPLEQLRDFQKKLALDFHESPGPRRVKTIAGVDVAYRADGLACGALVLLDVKTLQVTDRLQLIMPVRFPYIPGYLTFRELPVMLALCRQARAQGKLGDVLFCDGNGRLHPWRAGIATCLGVLLDHPVIGVGKSLLCGSVDASDEGDADPADLAVREGGEVVARAIRVSMNAKPVYVSPGQRVTLTQATRIAQKTFANHRVPEAIYQADRLTKQLRKLP